MVQGICPYQYIGLSLSYTSHDLFPSSNSSEANPDELHSSFPSYCTEVKPPSKTQQMRQKFQQAPHLGAALDYAHVWIGLGATPNTCIDARAQSCDMDCKQASKMSPQPAETYLQKDPPDFHHPSALLSVHLPSPDSIPAFETSLKKPPVHVSECSY